MPQQQSLATWFLLNAANDVSPSGMADVRTGEPVWAGGLNAGDYFDLTEREANGLSDYSVSILHAGRYRRVQIDPNANPASVRPGRHGTMPPVLAPELNIVITSDLAPFSIFRPVVFLNTIAPGNYGFIQELGIANIWLDPMGTTAPVNSNAFANVSGVWTATSGSGAGPYAITLDSVPAGAPQLIRAILINVPVLQG